MSKFKRGDKVIVLHKESMYGGILSAFRRGILKHKKIATIYRVDDNEKRVYVTYDKLPKKLDDTRVYMITGMWVGMDVIVKELKKSTLPLWF